MPVQKQLRSATKILLRSSRRRRKPLTYFDRSRTDGKNPVHPSSAEIISEIKTLALGSGTTKGVDADVADKVTDENLDSAVAFAKNFAKDHNCVVAITGAIDLVADADTCYVIRNGRAEMGSITGTGCQLSGMMTAYLVANPDEPLKAAAAAVCAMGFAGEIGWSHMKPEDGNSTYRNRIIDAIYHMDGETLEKGAKYEVR